MDDENASCTHNGEEDAHLSLLDLPVEIFLHICSFLDTSTLVHGLSLVCKQFYLNLDNDILLWKARINRIWPDASYSLLHPARPDKLFWKLSCVAIEKETALWKQQDSMKKFTVMQSRNISYIIESMLLMHIDGITYIVSSEHGLLCYKLFSHEKLEELPYYLVDCVDDEIRAPNHQEILCLTAMDHTIYGCTYEDTVMSWELMNTGLVYQHTYTIGNLRRCAYWQCITSCPEQALLATGSYGGTVYVYDSRASTKPIMEYDQSDTRPPVRTLAMDTEYILSTGGETVFVWDQRAGRIMKSITIPCKAIPTCMSMRRDWVCVGDSKAKIHMLDRKNDFELVKSYSTEHTRDITGVRLTHGCLITSSLDGTVIISSPTDPPMPIATLYSRFKEITSVDYLSDIFAIAGSKRIPYQGGGIDCIYTPTGPKQHFSVNFPTKDYFSTNHNGVSGPIKL